MKVIIVGVGKLGYKLADSLINTGISVTLVDDDADEIERINNHLDVLTVNANGLEVEVLKSLKIASYDLLIASTDSDETNSIICIMAKKLGCKKTVARIRNPEYMKQIGFFKKEIGIDHIVNPDLATANEITRYLMKSYTFYSGEYAKGKVQMIDININLISTLIGKKIRDLDLTDGLLIVAIMRNGNVIIPDGSVELLKDDIIYFMGESHSIESLVGKFHLKITNQAIKRAMILGGGNIAFYLARQLSSLNINVVIIEQDRDRCKYLSDKLDNVMIIHGDGTDINLLEEENLSSMNAFVGLTGYDEHNILMSIMAKQAGVDKAIAKISRQSYVNLIDKLDVDVAFNPTNITASDILKFIRGGKVVSVSLLLGGQAEVTELIVGENLPIVGKQISQLGLPKGIIIGAIVQGNDVIIPNGSTIIHGNDRLIIFCLEPNVPSLDIFLKPKKGGFFHELRNGN